jgi:hypothetical protein
MPEYREVIKTVEVHKGTGMHGFLKTIDSILRQPRVQEVTINTKGQVVYRRFVREDEPDEELNIDLSTLMPWSIIRNTTVEELTPLPRASAAVVVSQLFAAVSRDHLHPVAFAGHPMGFFWEWHGKTTSVALSREEAYGLPYMPDDAIPKDALVLCAAYGRDARLVDTRKAYKVAIPRSTT